MERGRGLKFLKENGQEKSKRRSQIAKGTYSGSGLGGSGRRRACVVWRKWMSFFAP